MSLSNLFDLAIGGQIFVNLDKIDQLRNLTKLKSILLYSTKFGFFYLFEKTRVFKFYTSKYMNSDSSC